MNDWPTLYEQGLERTAADIFRDRYAHLPPARAWRRIQKAEIYGHIDHGMGQRLLRLLREAERAAESEQDRVDEQAKGRWPG